MASGSSRELEFFYAQPGLLGKIETALYMSRGGNWVSQVDFKLGHKWVGHIIVQLSIYNLYKYKLNGFDLLPVLCGKLLDIPRIP